ncbi:MAG: 3-hydroxyisobutyrate dehydrogenase [Betaproteobacteria bacterium]|nr:3-hydroxyisobutyrate dehydrogenase [Betaproteobacteria bacterium]
MKITFIGLGNMGLPMAENLAKKYGNVLCYDRPAAVRARAKTAGLAAVAAAADAVCSADVLLTMLPDGKCVRDFYCGKNGALPNIKKGALIIDCSTGAPEEAAAMSAAAAKIGAAFLDAPVSGGIGGARAAALSFLAGGAPKDFRRARPVLAAMGKNIFHAGKTGAGQAAKLCNNMLLSVQMLGTCEALLLGQKMGLDAKVLSEIMRKSSGGNWVLEKYNPVPGVMPGAPAADGYRRGFLADLMVKDSDLALRSAKNAAVAAPLGTLANRIFRLHQKAGGGKRDFSGVINFLKQTPRRRG